MTKTVISKSGCKIRLTNERWNHIVKSHKELKEMSESLLRVVADPELIIQGRKNELIALSKINQRYLVVIYKEIQPTGFIITAFITSKLNQIKKRGVLWEKKQSRK